MLRALPEADFERLLPDLRTIPASARQVFHKRDAPIESVYFPNGGVVSVTAVLADGTMVETATIGVEGMVGLEAFFAENPVAPGETVMQVPDTDIEQLSVGAFRRELERRGVLSQLVRRYGAGDHRPDDAVDGVQCPPSHSGALLTLAVDDPRQDWAG